MDDDRPRIGISACLLGEPVRFDSGHKRDGFLADTFGAHVTWVAVCPEMEIGLGTPRESMRLIAVGDPPRARGARWDAAAVTLIMPKSGRDLTAPMRAYAGARAVSLGAEALSGFVLKKDSPSCGMERVRVYTNGGMAERAGRGLFAEALMRHLPNLPVEEEGRLSDPRLRENFVERVFAYRRVRQLFDHRWSAADLVAFHTAHKLTLMAHSPVAYRELGRMVAGVGRRPGPQFAAAYESGFMSALATIATATRQTNVLQHMLGYFKKTLDADARTEMLALIEDYRTGRVPLIVPLTMMRHHVRREKVAYLAGQVYLDPHPRELNLRNHV
jgi:uncharacterized protein YbgA (DUF1722 family)/uncharacterized protein YbbK (DUF523 family)